MKCGVVSLARSLCSMDGVKLPKPSGTLLSGEGSSTLGDGEKIKGDGVGEALGNSDARLLGADVGPGVTLGDGVCEVSAVALDEGEAVSTGSLVGSGVGRGVLDGGGVGDGGLSVGYEGFGYDGFGYDGDGSSGGGEFGSLVKSGPTASPRGAGAAIDACATTATAFTEMIPTRSAATNMAPDLRITSQILCQVPAVIKGVK